jgi:hypothetical protein
VALAVLGLLLAAGVPPAAARTDRPAATLLLPYFEVDLARDDGLTTRFTINNASATATLARVTLWTDLAVPVFAFTVYLTGFDVQRVDLRDVLEGRLPVTASPDPACDAPPLAGAALTALRNALRGQPSETFGGQCGGQAFGDGRARGYVTVDDMNACAAGFPGSPGYFAGGGLGEASNDNVLWGHYVLADRGRDGPLAAGGPLVHVPADGALGAPGTYTFYGGLLAFSAADNRRPLATSFAAPYVQPRPPGPGSGRTEDAAGVPYTRGTDLLVWRDVKAPSVAFACGGSPPWFPLGQAQAVAFDEQENPAEVAAGTTPFAAAAQRVPVDTPDLGLPFDFGWLFLDLSVATGAPVDPVAQAWVEVLHDPGGRLSVLQRPVQLDAPAP